LNRTPVAIEPMTLADLSQVLSIEQASFARPWTRSNFEHELSENPHALNLVARDSGSVSAFLCAYLVAGELMINDLAVDPSSRRRGLGGALLRHAIETARARGCRRATLEVRPSNDAALALYESFGFAVVGSRPGYYTDTNEDGLLLARDL
jgi:ribosomal-protein-alanine N-acetyltransferase